MNTRQIRNATRWLHIVAGAMFGAFLYSPMGDVAWFGDRAQVGCDADFGGVWNLDVARPPTDGQVPGDLTNEFASPQVAELPLLQEPAF